MNLSELTTLRVGGPARELLSPATQDELVTVTRDAWAAGDEVLLLGGGSNMVVSDDGFDGTVIRVITRGIEEMQLADARVRLRVQAGESWDGLVAWTVSQGLAGIEALSGIPGSCGAAPIQNIGAYGQELSASVFSVDFVDRITGERESLSTDDMRFGYRTSALKQGRAGLVVAIELELTRSTEGAVAYQQLADALSVSVGDRLPLADIRAAVLHLRASKGMLLDPADPDSVSAGSFFTNPIVSEGFARGLPGDVPRWHTEDAEQEPFILPLTGFDGQLVPRPPTISEQGTKLSAAWLIEQSGIPRGFRLPGSAAAVSSKHSLAIVNTGSATANEIGQLARYIQTRVLTEFGVNLQPEPVLVGVEV
ncbi:MAG: UDP-N-acetylmuramate dehydrogenase [Microbacteriaceae bacterium]|nr:UDP-N-acetylmuramate dehydrogenase [Microbacteriaceae bacterium]